MPSTLDSTFEGGSWSEDKEEARFDASVQPGACVVSNCRTMLYP